MLHLKKNQPTNQPTGSEMEAKQEVVADEGKVIACHTVEQWKEKFDGEKNSQKLVVVHFTATWCGPCRFISQTFIGHSKSEDFRHVLFLKVDVDKLKDVAEEHQIEAMPTFIFFKEGKEIHRIVGAHKDELQQRLRSGGLKEHEHVGLEGQDPPSNPKA